MFSSAAVAVFLMSCPLQYELNGTAKVQFPANSAHLPTADRVRITELLAPLVGNPLAEVEFDPYFPYRSSEGSPAYILAQNRANSLRNLSVETGISPDLVASGISAVGWNFEGDTIRAVPYPPEQLDRADVRYRVKAECHPLTHLARSLDPYRNK